MAKQFIKEIEPYVWTEEQQIAWLEYHLRGGKSGNTIYLNNPFWNSYREPK